MIVLDASAAVNMALRTPEGDAFISFLEEEGDEVWAPYLFQSEILSAFWKYVHVGNMTPEEAQDNINAAMNPVARFVNMVDLMPDIFQEAVRLDHSPYDLHYLVLAKYTGAMLYSLDDRLLALADEMGVRHIEKIDF